MRGARTNQEAGEQEVEMTIIMSYSDHLKCTSNETWRFYQRSPTNVNWPDIYYITSSVMDAASGIIIRLAFDPSFCLVKVKVWRVSCADRKSHENRAVEGQSLLGRLHCMFSIL